MMTRHFYLDLIVITFCVLLVNYILGFLVSN